MPPWGCLLYIVDCQGKHSHPAVLCAAITPEPCGVVPCAPGKRAAKPPPPPQWAATPARRMRRAQQVGWSPPPGRRTTPPHAHHGAHTGDPPHPAVAALPCSPLPCALCPSPCVQHRPGGGDTPCPHPVHCTLVAPVEQVHRARGGGAPPAGSPPPPRPPWAAAHRGVRTPGSP